MARGSIIPDDLRSDSLVSKKVAQLTCGPIRLLAPSVFLDDSVDGTTVVGHGSVGYQLGTKKILIIARR